MTDALPVGQRHKVVWPDLRWVWSKPYRCLAFGFGVGLLRPGSGTWGSVLALLLWWPMSWFFSHQWLGLLIAGLAISGVWVCDLCTRDLGVHDHVGVVWDEVVAVWMVLWVVPQVLWVMLLAFVLFRIFDIVKPQPIRLLDNKVRGGLGVMLDDWVAAVYACIATWAVWLIVSSV